MRKFVMKNKFFIVSIIMLVVLSIIDIKLSYVAIGHSWDQIVNMFLLVPPIFILIGLMDVWIPKETIISLMGEESKKKGMLLSFFLGALSAGPTLIAFPIAHLMIKKGAKYSNIIFFLMVWSSLKIPIIFFQISAIGIYLPLIINITLLIVFILGAKFSKYFFNDEDYKQFKEKAQEKII